MCVYVMFTFFFRSATLEFLITHQNAMDSIFLYIILCIHFLKIGQIVKVILDEKIQRFIDRRKIRRAAELQTVKWIFYCRISTADSHTIFYLFAPPSGILAADV